MQASMKLGLTNYQVGAPRSTRNTHLAFCRCYKVGYAITHPMTAIAITPASKLTNATACLPTPLLHKVGSSTKSPASISTHAAYISIPADMADMRPSINFSRTVYRHRKNMTGKVNLGCSYGSWNLASKTHPLRYWTRRRTRRVRSRYPRVLSLRTRMRGSV